MKRAVIKRAAAAILLLVTCLSLCSCGYIDEMEAKRATYTDEKHTELIFRDKLYKKIELDGGVQFIAYQKDHGFAAEQEVPLLLSEGFGDFFYFDSDTRVLMLTNGKSYVREELYDAYVEELSDASRLTSWCVVGVNYREQEVYPLVFDSELTDGIKTALQGEALDKEELERFNSTVGEGFGIYLCDSAAIVAKQTGAVLYSSRDGKYYVETNSVSPDDEKNGYTYETGRIYPLSDSISEKLDRLLNENNIIDSYWIYY